MKKRNVFHISEIIHTCLREQKFLVGDARRQCPWDYSEISDICHNCKWLVKQPSSTFQATDLEEKKIQTFLEEIKNGIH